MLEVYDADKNWADVVDIEAAFSKLEISISSTLKSIVSAVDSAIVIDKNTFKDRFGVTLYYSELSTGCKAAICVALMPEK